jgi:hypothetical protein
MANGTPLPADRPDEHQLLAERVQRLFKARGFRTPDIDDCLVIADRIIFVKNRNSKDDLHFVRLEQHGNAFLKHLAAIQPRFIGTADGAWMVRVAKEIEDFLDLHGGDVTIWVFAAHARNAWGKANEGKSPRSTERNAPLCKFITAALGEAGIHLSTSTVSAVLQGKRRQHRK